VVHDAQGQCVGRKRVFESQAIHGVLSYANAAVHDTSHHVYLIVWGGRWVGLARLTVETTAQPPVCLTVYRTVHTRDWILKTAVLPNHGRNEFDVVMLTAHNALYQLRHSHLEACQQNTEVEDFFQGPPSFLYSGDLCVVTPDLLIVAAGTVFGEILVWTCQRGRVGSRWLASTRHVFTGHRGSVFGVAISQASEFGDPPTRLLSSCSDDRTIRVWDISNCDRPADGSSTVPLSLDTGFGNASVPAEQQLATTWGHLSRIWGVDFVPANTLPGANELYLLSRGEDCTCQVWALEKIVAPSDYGRAAITLKAISHDRHHNGKNLWSLGYSVGWNQVSVYTGGADGQIIFRSLALSNSGKHFWKVAATFKDITKSPKALKQYLLLNESDCLATTDYGDLLRLTVEAEPNVHCDVLRSTRSRASVVLCSNCQDGIALIGTASGTLSALLPRKKELIEIPFTFPSALAWMQVASQSRSAAGVSNLCIVATMLSKKDVSVLWLEINDEVMEVQISKLNLPLTFVITSTCYDPATQVLCLGSRAGALAVYLSVKAGSEISEEPFCLRHIHGSDCVTSIRVLQNSHSSRAGNVPNELYILTTGRDGFYAVHHICWNSQEPAKSLTAETVHMSAPPIGANIEGAYFAENQSSNAARDLILYGFRSTEFVVWNESQQRNLFSVNCGGSHRSWAFQGGDHSATSCARSFVWTKAGSFNWFTTEGADHRVIQRGGHGREIKAVARSPKRYHGIGLGLKDVTLVATGAEDTVIRLLAVSSANLENENLAADAFRCVATLKQHTTGLQHLRFSASGDYLFSSAGHEEFYVWRLRTTVPCIGVGVLMYDSMPKKEDDSDARILSFDLAFDTTATMNQAEFQEPFTILAAYSNGKVKIMTYLPGLTPRAGHFETLRELVYGAFCLTQAVHLRDEFSQHRQILSAGTNGFLNLTVLSHGQNGHPLSTEAHHVHQNSVMAMDVVSLDPVHWLVVTGGDDNALGITVVSTRDGQQQFRSLLVPRAHAAALTALKIVTRKRGHDDYELVIISAAIDQRVSVWNIRLALYSPPRSKLDLSANKDMLEDLQVQKLGSAWTSVADVSGIELIDKTWEEEPAMDTNRGCDVLVVGVGMELLHVDHREKEGVDEKFNNRQADGKRSGRECSA